LQRPSETSKPAPKHADKEEIDEEKEVETSTVVLLRHEEDQISSSVLMQVEGNVAVPPRRIILVLPNNM
jgi:hypothetical protein